MKTKLIGSILMILGTCVGAGMLALPVATAYETLTFSTLLLISAWLVMTLGAFALVEVNLWLPEKTNLISMAESTLGRAGKYGTWLVYLLLLYSLLCAYITSSSDVIKTLFHWANISIPHWGSSMLAVLILGSIVYRGIYSVDIVNRGLMSLKILAYLLLVFFIAPHIKMNYLAIGDSKLRLSTFMVMITSFGYAIIVPSLRGYLKSNKKLLHRAVVIGSLLPLVIYFVWIISIQGLIPKTGENGLWHIAQTGRTTALLMESITHYINRSSLATISTFFISICALTSFLGVSICLVDFITDGLKQHHRDRQPFYVYLLTFLPPLLIVLWFPNIFIQALSYAGIFCLLILALLPFLMLYSGRHLKKLSAKKHTWLSQASLLVVLIFTLSIIMLAIFFR